MKFNVIQKLGHRYIFLLKHFLARNFVFSNYRFAKVRRGKLLVFEVVNVDTLSFSNKLTKAEDYLLDQTSFCSLQSRHLAIYELSMSAVIKVDGARRSIQDYRNSC